MATLLVTDELWAAVEPLLPRHVPSPKGGKPRTPDRVCLTGIPFVLKTGLQWEDFPHELGCCGMTLWNRLDAWRRAGVWTPCTGSCSTGCGAPTGSTSPGSSSTRPTSGRWPAEKNGPEPVDRGRAGSKHHLIVDAGGTPLAAILTGGNEPDVTQLIPLVDAVPAVRGKPGAPLRKPKLVMGDRAYASEDRRMALSCRNIGTRIPKQRDPHGSGLGALRYVVEQTIALLHQYRRLRVRYERRDDTHEAFLTLGCAMICWRRLHSSSGYL